MSEVLRQQKRQQIDGCSIQELGNSTYTTADYIIKGSVLV